MHGASRFGFLSDTRDEIRPLVSKYTMLALSIVSIGILQWLLTANTSFVSVIRPFHLNGHTQ